MPKTIDLKTVYANVNGEKVPVPALKGTDAEVTKGNIEAALGYTPADEENAATKEDLSELSDVKVGYSEVVNRQLLMYSDSTKEHLLATLDLPSGGVVDVKALGESIVNENGIADIPAAVVSNFPTTSKAGLFRANRYGGLTYNSDGVNIKVLTALKRHIDGRDGIGDTIDGGPIAPNMLNYAVTAALTDAKKMQLTDAQKAVAQDTLGIVTLTQEEYDLISVKGENTIYLIKE